MLAIIYVIIVSAGANIKHNIGGSVAVCSIHLAFRLLPDNCFCLSDKAYFSRNLQEDVYDSIALVASIVGCIFAALQNALGDSGVSVSVCLALVTTVAFAIGKSVEPETHAPVRQFNDILDNAEDNDEKM